MRTTHFKASSQANSWGRLLSVSIGASVPSVVCRSSRFPTLQRSVTPVRLFTATSGSSSLLTGTLPSVVEGWLWQQKFDLPAWSPSWNSVRTQATTTQFGIEAVAEGTSSADSAASKSTPSETAPGSIEASSEQNGSSQASRTHSSKGDQTEQLCFKAAAACIPHPAKIEKGGEDAYFISDDGLALGVADGVGSWGEVNVDAGIYSRALMSNAKRVAEYTAASPEAPQTVLVRAYGQTHAKGSCTACIVMLDKSTLRATNVGDSGFMVLRNNQIVFQSPQQQHQFNFPYQLGGPESRGDQPEAAEKFTVGLQKGDVVVLATDGLIDNVFPQETASLLSTIQRRGESPRVAASGLAQYAKFRAEDTNHLSPFAFGAQRAGYRFMGGKLDDITVVVAYVTSASEL